MPQVSLEVDAHGALTPREPAEWLVCFVPPLEMQWWHWILRSSWKHCFAMRREAHGNWTVFEPWWSRMFLAGLSEGEAARFLCWAATGAVLRVREAIPGNSNQIRGWMTCAALIAHLLGRKYWVWTPRQLFYCLVKEPATQYVSQQELMAYVGLE